MKNKNNLALADLQRPYYRWENLYDCVDHIESDESFLARVFDYFYTQDDKISDNTFEGFPNFTDIRRLVSCIISARMNESAEMGAVNITERVGGSVSYLSKFKMSADIANPYSYKTTASGKNILQINQKIRPFSFALARLSGLCSFMFGCTCHYLVFGENRRIILPLNMRVIERQIRTITKTKIKKLVALGVKYRDEAIEEYNNLDESTPNKEGCSQYGQYRPQHIIMRERIKEMAADSSDMDHNSYLFFTEPTVPSQYRITMHALMSGSLNSYYTKGKEPKDKNNQYLPNLEIPMFWSLASILSQKVYDKALDYFICNDYFQVPGGATPQTITGDRCPIYTIDEKGAPQEITDIDTLRILSFCAALPEGKKEDYIAEILSSSAI